MRSSAALKVASALSLTMLLALSGCAGNDEELSREIADSIERIADTIVEEVRGEDQTPVMNGEEPLSPAPGLTVSDRGQIYSNSRTTTLEYLLNTSLVNPPPLTSAVFDDWADDRTEIRDGAFVDAIYPDSGGGGFYVEYTIDNESTKTVYFSQSDLDSSGDYYYKQTQDGDLWLWYPPTDFDHYEDDLYHSYSYLYFRPVDQSGEFDFVFDFGGRTQFFPSGTAIYNGYLFSEIYNNDSSSSDLLYGGFVLDADFRSAALSGSVDKIYLKRPDSSDYHSLPGTSRFVITEGRIVDGHFTATLTGVDSNSSNSYDDSVRGFSGDMLGRFYGPNAEEVGGVMNATRAESDQVARGSFSGFRFSPSQLGSAAMVAGGIRDYSADVTAALFEDDGTATVERGGSGWILSIGGEAYEIGDDELRYGTRGPYNGYSTRLPDGTISFFSSETRGFAASHEFDYFDVKRWREIRLVTGTDLSVFFPGVEDREQEEQIFLVHGTRTPNQATGAVGSASYAGKVRAVEYPSDTTASGADVRGDLSLTVNFGSDAVDGGFTNLTRRASGESEHSAIQGMMTFDAIYDDGVFVTDNLTSSGDLAGYADGSVRGTFYGPAADEVGGVFDAEDATNHRVLTGWFGGDKQ